MLQWWISRSHPQKSEGRVSPEMETQTDYEKCKKSMKYNSDNKTDCCSQPTNLPWRIQGPPVSLTSTCRKPQLQHWCCFEASGLTKKHLHWYRTVDVYIQRFTFWYDDSRGTLPHVTTCIISNTHLPCWTISSSKNMFLVFEDWFNIYPFACQSYALGLQEAFATNSQFLPRILTQGLV